MKIQNTLYIIISITETHKNKPAIKNILNNRNFKNILVV